MKEKISAYIDSKRDDFIRELKSLVDIKSVREAPLPGMPFGKGPAKALERAVEISAEKGFSMLDMENYAGEISFGKDPVLMILAHLDVVAEGDNWTRQPYNMTVENGVAYGRGTTDDKGPALACLYALSCVRELFGEPERGVKLVLGSGEETGSEDMDYYFSKREKLPCTLSPDADYPLINIEKGRYAPVFYKNIKCDGDKTLVDFRGGETANIVPSKASALIRGFERDEILPFIEKAEGETGAEFTLTEEENGIRIYSAGVSSHAAFPQNGNNAQTALIHLINLLPLTENELSRSFEALGRLVPHKETDGLHMGVKMADEKSGELTFNFGVLSLENGALRGNFDLRCPLCSSDENVRAEITERLEAEGFSFEKNPPMTPVHYVPEDAPLIKTALSVYEEYTGEKGKCLAIGGGTYVHGIEGGVAFGVEFPGKDYRIHGADEFAVIDELLLTAKMYASVIYKLCY